MQGPLEKLFRSLESLSSEDVEELCAVEEKLHRELGLWEGYAEGGGFLGGGEVLSLADCAFFPVLAYLEYYGLVLWPDYPHLAAYSDRVLQLPASRESYPRHWSPHKYHKNLFARLHSLCP